MICSLLFFNVSTGIKLDSKIEINHSLNETYFLDDNKKMSVFLSLKRAGIYTVFVGRSGFLTSL